MKKTSSARPPGDHSAETLVRQAARSVGFSAVGITGAAPSEASTRVFDRWIDEDRHGDMRYLSGGRDKRRNPALLLDGARSVICVAVNYFSLERSERNRRDAASGAGVVAMYAHGGDYHDVMAGMLRDLTERLRKLFPGVRTRACVDTQPISERDFAVKSGVAWLGKNTCVISPDYGSWIFLGELITDLDLEADKPLESLCGSCSRCQDACPTGALDEAYFIDARRCISYLTIEKRGDIPEEFHRLIGDYVFGCDTCQRVCPFNKIASDTVVFRNDVVNPVVDMTLEELVELTDARFKELTRGSAIARAKANGLRRNARIVLANVRRRKTGAGQTEKQPLPPQA